MLPEAKPQPFRIWQWPQLLFGPETPNDQRTMHRNLRQAPLLRGWKAVPHEVLRAIPKLLLFRKPWKSALEKKQCFRKNHRPHPQVFQPERPVRREPPAKHLHKRNQCKYQVFQKIQEESRVRQGRLFSCVHFALCLIDGRHAAF